MCTPTEKVTSYSLDILIYLMKNLETTFDYTDMEIMARYAATYCTQMQGPIIQNNHAEAQHQQMRRSGKGASKDHPTTIKKENSGF